MTGSTEWQSTPKTAETSMDGEMETKIRIVIGDDHAEVLMATADLIKECPGVEVVSLCSNVDDLVLSAVSHEPDLVFVDAWLRGGGAEAATSRIKAVSPGIVVVALASAKELELVLKLRAAGAAACYEKELLSAVLPEILASVSRR